MSVQTPSETLEKTSENAYGTLEIAEIPDPEYNIRTTPRLLITSTIKSASSPLTTGSASVAVAFTRSAFPSVSLFLPEFFSFQRSGLGFRTGRRYSSDYSVFRQDCPAADAEL